VAASLVLDAEPESGIVDEPLPDVAVLFVVGIVNEKELTTLGIATSAQRVSELEALQHASSFEFWAYQERKISLRPASASSKNFPKYLQEKDFPRCHHV